MRGLFPCRLRQVPHQDDCSLSMKEVCLSLRSQHAPLIMNILKLRDRLVRDYAGYTRSFMKIANAHIRDKVEAFSQRRSCLA